MSSLFIHLNMRFGTDIKAKAAIKTYESRLEGQLELEDIAIDIDNE